MKSFLLLSLAGAVSAQVAAYGQCGGADYTGSTTCVSGYYCEYSNAYYSQCVPGSATTTATATSATTSPPKPVCTANCDKTRYAGINLSGFDFGCDTSGDCPIASVYNIVRDDNGVAQMQHFASLGLNAFRLPVSWQYLVNNVLGGPLNQTNFGWYNELVQACLNTGADWCEIDIHNYARWNGSIIGQGGPTNAQFASVWSQLATYYANESRIVFGVMNEPHDIPDIETWASSVQAAVTAIREAGATSQTILLPGNNYTSAAAFISSGSAAALAAVKNLDGSTTNLVMDVHQYLDSDNSGTSDVCVTNNTADAFEPLAVWLRANGRQAFLSETGGGNTASCEVYMCQELEYLNANNDVYLGWTGWAAGGFASTYVLSETPTETNGTWTDTALVTQCIAGAWVNVTTT